MWAVILSLSIGHTNKNFEQKKSMCLTHHNPPLIKMRRTKISNNYVSLKNVFRLLLSYTDLFQIAGCSINTC